MNTWEIKLQKANEEFNKLWNDSRARNIGFGAAGNLSKASSNYHSRHRDKIGNIACKIADLKRAVKISNNIPFTLEDINDAKLSIKPEIPDIDVNMLMTICSAADLIRKSFKGQYKSILKYPIYLDFQTRNNIVFKVSPDNKVEQAYIKEEVNLKAYWHSLEQAKKDIQWAIDKNEELNGNEWLDASEISREHLKKCLNTSQEKLAQEYYIYFRYRSHAFGDAYNVPIDKQAYDKWTELTGEKPIDYRGQNFKIIF